LVAPCTYCGYAPGATKGGIDRVDSKGGYTPDNVAPCCWPCNLMKNSMRLDLWLAHLRRIVRHASATDAHK
jgi:hypothetical protein